VDELVQVTGQRQGRRVEAGSPKGRGGLMMTFLVEPGAQSADDGL